MTIDITPALESFMQTRRAYYREHYPGMTESERIDLLTEDLVREHYRLKDERVEVEVG